VEQAASGIYLVGRREADQRASTWAAVAWAGSTAVASGLTAAWWWRLRDWAPAAAEVTVPRTRSRRCPRHVVLRRRNLDPADLVVLRGLPVLWQARVAVAWAGVAASRGRGVLASRRVLHRLLREAKMDGWVVNHLVMLSGIEYWIDVAFVARRLAVEVDGWAWHSDVDRFTYDRRRQNALILAGWTVLRFTWHDLTSRPQTVIAQIKAAVQ
jgi:very-short-patch-repair endonuclease